MRLLNFRQSTLVETLHHRGHSGELFVEFALTRSHPPAPLLVCFAKGLTEISPFLSLLALDCRLQCRQPCGRFLINGDFQRARRGQRGGGPADRCERGDERKQPYGAKNALRDP